MEHTRSRLKDAEEGQNHRRWMKERRSGEEKTTGVVLTCWLSFFSLVY